MWLMIDRSVVASAIKKGAASLCTALFVVIVFTFGVFALDPATLPSVRSAVMFAPCHRVS